MTAAYSRYDEVDTLEAAADYSEKQFYLMKLTGTGNKGTLCSAATDRVYGVQYTKAKSGEPMGVVTEGDVPVICDGSGTAIADGDLLASDTSGRGVKCTTADRPVFGIARQACTAANMPITVRLTPNAVFRTPG